MHRIGRVHILLTILLVGAGALLLPHWPAQAAGYGPGFDLGLGRIGAYVTPLGTQAYCLEIAKNRPLGATDGGTVGGWGGLGPEALGRLNWVLHSYGQSADPVITAAVNLYVWSVADPGTYGSHGMSGDEYYSGRAGDARAAVLANLAEIRAAADGVPGAGSVEVELAPDLTGRAIVHDPAGMGATLTIEGADAVGPVVVADGAVVEFVAQPGAGDRTAAVEATARFAWRSFPAAITVHDSGPEQHLAGPAGEEFVAVGRAQVPLEFHPVIESAVTSPVLAIGERAVDRLAFAVATDSPAPWRAGAGVTAKGTLYGPFAAPPQEGLSPPPGAPVAWSEVIERAGPHEFTTSGGFAPAEPGHYTWVWTIAAEDQPGDSLLPVGYEWSDRFGLPAESFEVVTPLPATGAEGDPLWWLAGLGALLLGLGLVGIAAVARIRGLRVARTAPS